LEIRVSRRLLGRLIIVVVLFIVITGLGVLGRAVTPRDAAGRPLLLSPSLKATLEYRAQAYVWVRDFRHLDHELDVLLEDETDIYQQSQVVNSLMDQALGLAQEIELTQAPAALASLGASLSQTSLAYLDSTEAVANWVGAPTPDKAQAAQTALVASRELLAQVEKNRWLVEPETQPLEGDPNDAGDWLWTTPVP
jgi:hypothetical protein